MKLFTGDLEHRIERLEYRIERLEHRLDNQIERLENRIKDLESAIGNQWLKSAFFLDGTCIYPLSENVEQLKADLRLLLKHLNLEIHHNEDVIKKIKPRP